MNRVDFHTISAILFQHLKEADTSQIDYVYMIFASFSNDTEDFMYDNGLVCKWIKGQAKVSPRIVNYYVDKSHKEAMYQDMKKELFPYLSDFANAAKELKDAGYQVNQIAGQTGYMPAPWLHDFTTAGHDTPEVTGYPQYEWTHVQLSKLKTDVE